MNAEGSQTTTIDLEPGSEWRFELEADEDIAVRVSQAVIMLSDLSLVLVPNAGSRGGQSEGRCC